MLSFLTFQHGLAKTLMPQFLSAVSVVQLPDTLGVPGDGAGVEWVWNGIVYLEGGQVPVLMSDMWCWI